ncbi:MAG: type II toxin-antitoxin system RelE/ParE family toxin [Clostridiales bacterium]|nr:type II toxin-antitoxin system RelE/ParE family toxin [Clostridiales bacterium]
MKQYKVEITNQALRDMEAIYHHIATVFHAPDTAMKQYDRIAGAIETLEQLPERCRLMDSQPERERGIRQLLVDRYSAFYVIEHSKVTVLRVFYSASDIAVRLREQEGEKLC